MQDKLLAFAEFLPRGSKSNCHRTFYDCFYQLLSESQTTLDLGAIFIIQELSPCSWTGTQSLNSIKAGMLKKHSTSFAKRKKKLLARLFNKKGIQCRTVLLMKHPLKDEVRALGRKLGLLTELLERHIRGNKLITSAILNFSLFQRKAANIFSAL
ncbi:hypothetical protein OUZ56_031483 [Daphnia magna]|uniref:Uncharacterized protein n=1 Tax=Daphnia magna TaxID=35525 RepID=A0ABQ9ZUU5_9CRUS|nr:hypothetical protein OUZ56_031483 [Daphnia magna]